MFQTFVFELTESVAYVLIPSEQGNVSNENTASRCKKFLVLIPSEQGNVSNQNIHGGIDMHPVLIPSEQGNVSNKQAKY